MPPKPAPPAEPTPPGPALPEGKAWFTTLELSRVLGISTGSLSLFLKRREELRSHELVGNTHVWNREKAQALVAAFAEHQQAQEEAKAEALAKKQAKISERLAARQERKRPKAARRSRRPRRPAAPAAAPVATRPTAAPPHWLADMFQPIIVSNGLLNSEGETDQRENDS